MRPDLSALPVSRAGFAARGASAQRGVVLFITMISLVIMLVAGIALVRSLNSTLILSGNLAFKRDLVNQGERGILAAQTLLATGGALGTDSTRQADSLANNYSSSILASDNHGVPTVLLDDSAYATAGMSAADVTDSTSGVTIRYVIDRLCTASGASGKSNCAVSSIGSDTGGTAWVKKAGGASLPVYRISIRVTGPRNTQTYLQTTVSL